MSDRRRLCRGFCRITLLGLAALCRWAAGLLSFAGGMFMDWADGLEQAAEAKR